MITVIDSHHSFHQPLLSRHFRKCARFDPSLPAAPPPALRMNMRSDS
jgi:hypothetical protein